MTAGGQFDRRITLQRSVTVEDGEYGPLPGGWENVTGLVRVPAQVWDTLPGNAERKGQAIDLSERPARVRMRYVRGITSDMRVIVHNETDRIYQISAGPAEMGRREFIEFTIKEYSS